MIEQKTVSVINEKRMWEYTKEELHSILGDFEKEYKEAATGEMIRNEILGYVKEGTVNRALMLRAIVKHNENGKDEYFINLPEYRDYQEKYNAMKELASRRNYARKINEERFDN